MRQKVGARTGSFKRQSSRPAIAFRKQARLTPPVPETPKSRWYQLLYVQVLIAVAIGILLGHFQPSLGKDLKPLGDGFIKLIKMIIAPIIFCTVVHGIASMSDLKKLGRIGFKSLLYFEVVSTFALVLGVLSAEVLRPGAGFNIDVATLDPSIGADYASKAHDHTATDFLLNIIPKTFVGAFAEGDLLQILLISLLTAFGLSSLGEKGKPLLHAIDNISGIFFAIMRIIVKLAPIGAFGAMAFTVGSYGIESLRNLGLVIFCFYLASIVFVAAVLGVIARICGFSIFSFLYYIRDELFLVLGTSSSESAMPGIMEKLQRLGCTQSTVGLVIPTGYSFNLDGTNIYLTIATLFLAQATNIDLSLTQKVSLILVAMLSSKGASGITGAGFVTLAATLAVVPSVPVESLALLVGIDRFMSECRALTNFIGNGVATLAVSRWENEISGETIRSNLKAGLAESS
jgi:aerobic C4-dicarboxylate transport protein